MNYLKIYNNLIVKRKFLPLYKKLDKCAKHHILPKCLGGSDEKENLINLTYKEHFFAHHLLVKIFMYNSKLWNAYWLMANNKGNITSMREYDKIFLKISEIVSMRFKGKVNKGKLGDHRTYEEMMGKEKADKVKEMISLALKGVEKTKEHRKHLSEAHLLSRATRGEKNGMYGHVYTEETLNKMRGSKSEEHKLHIKENHADLSGEKSYMFGDHRTYEEKYAKEVADTKRKNHSEQMKGENNPMFGKTSPLKWKVCVNDTTKTYYIEKEEVFSFLQKGCVLGKVKRKKEKEIII